VRISVYVQAFIAFIPSMLKIVEDIVIIFLNKRMTVSRSPAESQAAQTFVATAANWNDIFSVVYPILLLGCALIISAVVQALTFSLTAYHALVVLNLSWIITFSAAAAFVISANDRKRPIIGQRDNRVYLIMAACHISHLTLSAAFGLWFFSSIARFVRGGSGCTSSTLYYALWVNLHAEDPAFRHFWLAIYSIVVIPLINLMFVTLVSLIAFAVATCAATPLVFIVGCCCYRLGSLKLELLGRFYVGLLIFFPPVLMVLLTEKMIEINTVGADESLWTFGQTLALLVALPPA